VSGYIEKVQFAAGAKVKKGDILFLMDNKPYKSQLNFANAEQEKANVKYELAKNDLARAEKLVAEKAISTEEFDMRSHAVREASAILQSAQASVYAAQLNVSYCEIRAPISGRISREVLTEGNLVNTSDNTVLATIVSLDPVYVYVDADERSILNYRTQNKHHELNGSPVSLELNGDTKNRYQGHIDYVAPKEDIKTGTISLRGVFDNHDELLSPGFFARMRVQNNAPYQALLLPDKAIGKDQTQHFVWVVKEENQVEYRKVTLGMRDNNLRVIREGINPQEWIVIEGIQKIRPNTQVNPERIDAVTSTDTH
jgi:multidrug efflux system membrane fusion protein